MAETSPKASYLETLRTARTFNDVFMCMRRIAEDTDAIVVRHKKPLEVSELLGQAADLEIFNYAVQMSRLSTLDMSDSKAQKLRSYVSEVAVLINRAQTLVMATINQKSVDSEPQALKQLTDVALKLPRLKGNKNTFVVAHSAQNFTRYVILRGVYTSRQYVVSEFIIGLHCTLNDEGFPQLTISFPTRLFVEDSVRLPVSAKNIATQVEGALSHDVIGIVNVRNRTQDRIVSLASVKRVYAQDSDLCIELVTGARPTDINSVLSNVLPLLHKALGLNPRATVIHNVGTTKDGNKIIKIGLLNRNFSENRTVRDLKRKLQLDTETYKFLLGFVQ